MENERALLDNHMYCSTGMVNMINNKDSGKTEYHVLAKIDMTITSVNEKKICMLAICKEREDEEDQALQKCQIYYLIQDERTDKIGEKKTFCKFRKIDSIFRQVRNVCVECTPENVLFEGGSTGNVIAFYSPAGGVGCTSAAVACARYFAARQRKTLYLNLEKNGNTELYFQEKGQEDSGDAIYELKKGNGSTNLQIENLVRQDVSGVYFLESAISALGKCALTKSDIERLLHELKSAGNYQTIVIDFKFSFDEHDWAVLDHSSRYIMVADGRTESNRKCEKAYCAIIQKIKHERTNIPVEGMMVFYNRFSSKNGAKLLCPNMEELGEAPEIKAPDYKMIINEMSKNDSFGKLL